MINCISCGEFKKSEGRGMCKSCYMKDYRKRTNYYDNNKEHIKAKSKSYHEDNREKCLKVKRERYLKNRESHSKSSRLYREQNVHILANPKKKRQVGQPVLNFANKGLMKFLYMDCPKGYEVDHIIPRKHEQVSGLHNEYNIQIIPALENAVKKYSFDGTYDNESWRQLLKYDRAQIKILTNRWYRKKQKESSYQKIGLGEALSRGLVRTCDQVPKGRGI